MENSSSRVRVEMDVFSGRPNPAWELDGANARQVMEALRDLRFSPRHDADRDDGKLGFRGFFVELSGEAGSHRYRVTGDVVEDLGRGWTANDPRIRSLIRASMPPEVQTQFSGMLGRESK